MFFLDHIWLIPLLPAFGAAIMFFFGRKLQKSAVSAICVGAVVVSFLWAVGLGAFIYFGSLAVGVSSGTAFIFAALGACAIFIFVRVFGEDVPPRRQAKVRRDR